MLHREKVKCYLTSDYSLFLDLLRKAFSIITCAVNFYCLFLHILHAQIQHACMVFMCIEFSITVEPF